MRQELRKILARVFAALLIFLIGVVIYKQGNPYAYPGLENRILLVLVPSGIVLLYLYLEERETRNRLFSVIMVTIGRLHESKFMRFCEGIWERSPSLIRTRVSKVLAVLYTYLHKMSGYMLKQDPKEVVSHAFLGMLLIVALQSVIPQPPLEWARTPVMIAAVVLGAITFYLNRGKLDEIEDEARQEEIEEKRREMEFAGKYPRINRVWGVRWIVRWMYKEGWWYSGILFLIFILFFITRLYENNFINGSDNFNVLGIKNMYENGVSFYKYSPITDFFMLQIVKTFGFSLTTTKYPFIVYSFITLIFIYLIGQLSSKNLALLSSFLYVISPWAIIQSRITRDYSFDLMVGSIVLYLCLIIYKKVSATNNIKNHVRYFILFSLIPLTTILLYKYNRSQTLTVGIYALLASIFIIECIFKRIINNKSFLTPIYWISISSILLLGLYCIERFPFEFGFKEPDFIFFNIFFDPQINSPWQWFHSINLEPFFLFALFSLGIFSFGSNQPYKKHILIIFSAFVFGLLLYTLKYESHVNYIPVRYIYFLFIPYVIIFANALLNLFKPFKDKLKIIILVISLISMINSTALMYSINPHLAYEKEGISNVKIDNIGIGRFNMLEVVSYVENELNVSNDTTIVFDGRYEEFILNLNRPMDKERGLLREDRWQYDISKNTYVQSSYYGYSELKEAAVSNTQGIYISNENTIFNENKKREIELYDDDFYLYGTSFKFIININGFRVYSWNTNGI